MSQAAPTDPNLRLSHLRSHLLAEPSLEGWDRIIRMLLRWPTQAPDTAALALEYAAEHIASWCDQAPGPWSPERVHRCRSWEAFLPNTAWHMHTEDGDPEHCAILFLGNGRFKYKDKRFGPDVGSYHAASWGYTAKQFKLSGIARWALEPQEDSEGQVLRLEWNQGPYTDTFPDVPTLPTDRVVGIQGVDSKPITFWWLAHVG